MIGTRKGQYGYIRALRTRRTLYAALLLAAVAAVDFGARAHLGTEKHLCTIAAALGCIPAAKAVVGAVMAYLAGGCSAEARERISGHGDGLAQAYDLFLTSYQKNFQLSHVCVTDTEVCALTESEKTDAAEAEKHIRSCLAQDGLRGYHVKIFRESSPYLERIDALAARAGDIAPEESGRAEKALAVLYAVAL